MALVQVEKPVKRRAPLVKKVKKGGGNLGKEIGAGLGAVVGTAAAILTEGGSSSAIPGFIAGGATLGQMLGEGIAPGSSKLIDPNVPQKEINTLGLRESSKDKAPDEEQPLDARLAESKVSPQGLELYQALQALEEFDDDNLINELGRPLMVGFFQDLQVQNPGVFDQGDQQPQGQGLGQLAQRQPQPGLGQLAQRPQQQGLGGLV